MQRKFTLGLASGLLATMLSISSSSYAQNATDDIAKYREMIADGNPSELYEAAGEVLWKKPAGPKNATLEKCDLGLGPGVVKGAAAQLPRYFKDTNKVQDLESRLMTCMQKLQGRDPQEMVDAPFQKGPMDFSCASCHGEDGKRIRLQDLPNITTQKGAAMGWGYWPAYRVSSGQFWTMQQRLNDCYRQQRFPFPIYGSDLTVALSMYMAKNANGGTVETPGLKR